jgi:hypothetical protein
VVILVEAGDTVTFGVVGFCGGGVVLPPPPQADIPMTSPLTKRRVATLKPLFTGLILAIGVHWTRKLRTAGLKASMRPISQFWSLENPIADPLILSR